MSTHPELLSLPVNFLLVLRRKKENDESIISCDDFSAATEHDILKSDCSFELSIRRSTKLYISFCRVKTFF